MKRFRHRGELLRARSVVVTADRALQELATRTTNPEDERRVSINRATRRLRAKEHRRARARR